MAPVSPGQPGLRDPGDGRGTPAPRRARRLAPALVALAAALTAIDVADDAGVVGHGAVGPLLRVAVSSALLLAVCGFGLTRLLLPDGLRRHEALWVLPVGGCALALAMTVLGFAYVPFRVSLALCVLGALALATFALRRRPLEAARGVRSYLRGVGWPAYVALLLAAIALVPLFRAGFATVEGEGQDAHLAVGTAMFLQHNHPLGEDIGMPVDQVPLVWRSKQPIYYVLAAAATASGKEVYETISTVQALLLALACLGFFLVARELAGAPRWAALGAMAVVGLDRMVLHTVVHPYYNQTWGFMALPFALVLAWWLVRAPSRGGAALLALFLAVLGFAYPLALPIPLLALAVLAWPQRRRLGELRRLYHGRRSLLWVVPLAAVLLVPLWGVAEKLASAVSLLVSTRSLGAWGGDLDGWYPEPWFLAAPSWEVFVVVGPLLAFLAWRTLRAMPARLRATFLALFAFGLAAAVYFRLRDYGWYFHFKALAFIAPLLLALAAAGAARVPRKLGILALVVLVSTALSSARDEVNTTFDQLPQGVLALREVDERLPPGASVRLDLDPQQQNWTAFWLHGQPLCSYRPLFGTSYPHVLQSRKADYILTPMHSKRPRDAVGPRVLTAGYYALWRAKPDLPGPEICSQRMVQTVKTVSLS